MSDFEKDADEERLEEENMKFEEEEIDDGFVVPDWYLSENEVTIGCNSIKWL